MRNSCCFCLLLFLASTALHAQLTLHGVFADGMVLQQQAAVPIWGTAKPKTKISLSFNHKTYSTLADLAGNWEIVLPPTPASAQPYRMVVVAKPDSIVLSKVFFGDVWLCAGQSNMEFELDKAAGFAQEKDQINDSLLRHAKVPKRFSAQVKTNLEHLDWQSSTPTNAGKFTAIGYYFAKKLREQYPQLPIGLIQSAWGGTRIECWMSAPALQLEQANQMAAYHEKQRLYHLTKVEAANGPVSTQDEGFQQEQPIWAQPDFDDSSWKKMQLPSWFWGDAKEDHDGAFWLRKSFVLDQNHLAEGLILDLGYFSDAVQIWFNGQLIGSSSVADPLQHHRYTSLAKLLRLGQNVIALRIQDQGGACGNWNDEAELHIQTPCQRIVLNGEWRFRLSAFQYLPNEQFDTGPMLLYNAMIAPLQRLPIKGVLWYQGESNTWPLAETYRYREYLAALIRDWRLAWRNPTLPFLVVQLPAYGELWENPNRNSNWALMRESQAKALEQLPHTALAIALDAGDPQDVHPTNKQLPAERLALLARKLVYVEPLQAESPSLDRFEVQGDQVVLHFKNCPDGLMVKDKYGYLRGFVVAGEDRVWHWAKASIQQGNVVTLSAEAVPHPVAARYAWGHSPIEANLYSKAGLPVGTFRTDTWPFE